MDLAQAYAVLVAELRAQGVRIVSKERVWHQHAIGWLLGVITLGRQAAYLDHYVTTIGCTIYVTPDWDRRALADRYATLRHERVHVEQFRRWGTLPMALAYLLLPLPMGLAWCRMRLERAAYEESMRVRHALGGRAAVEAMRAHVIAQFTSGSYGWMWPFPRAVARWFDRFADALDARR
jgi:hypothetical protein